MPYDFVFIGSRTKVHKDDENNENVRREIGNRQLKHTDSNVYIGLPYLSYYVPRGRDYVPHLSDEHKTLVIDSWDFVPGFISEVGVKRQFLLLMMDFNKIVLQINKCFQMFW